MVESSVQMDHTFMQLYMSFAYKYPCRIDLL